MRRFWKYAIEWLGIKARHGRERLEIAYEEGPSFGFVLTTMTACLTVIFSILCWRYAMDLQMFGDIKQLQEQRRIDSERIEELEDEFRVRTD